jgi:uncharacterized protein with von Willebrand factor type A (vWA) domain
MPSAEPPAPPPSQQAADLLLAGFARALRRAGAAVTTDRTAGFLTAVAELGAEEPGGVYWAGRATLCAGRDDLERYDRVFAAWFSGTLGGKRVASPAARRCVQDPLGALGEGADADRTPARALASDVDVLSRRDVADLDAAERARVAAILGQLRPRPPWRTAARHRPAARGQVDARRTLREQLRRAGEPGPIRSRQRGIRPRRVVLLVDVSGSMAPYAETLLRLAHVLSRAAPADTEVFTIGTRLTRVTRALATRAAEPALRAAAEAVPDWSGGTRLGEVLEVFLDRWGQRGLARGAVVVIFSDGWERRDPAALAAQMQRLARLAHRVVWVNPHRGKPGYLPVQTGIAAALPYVDDFLAGHSLETFTDLLRVLADA